VGYIWLVARLMEGVQNKNLPSVVAVAVGVEILI